MGSQLGFSTSMCFMDVQLWRLDQTWCRKKKRASDCLDTITLAQQWLVLGIWTYSKPKKQIGFSSYLTIEILHFFAFSKDYSWNILKHLETSWNILKPQLTWNCLGAQEGGTSQAVFSCGFSRRCCVAAGASLDTTVAVVWKIGRCFFSGDLTIIYPLVNIQKTMEHHHF